MKGRPLAKMSREDRAKQFAPFSALNGLYETLAKKEKIVVDKALISEDRAEELDEKFHQLEEGLKARIVYYSNGEYLQVTGMVSKIQTSSRILQIVETRIPFDDIYEIEIIDK